MGEPSFKHGTIRGCESDSKSCRSCNGRGECIDNGKDEPYCLCNSGWTGKRCLSQTNGITLSNQSYAKISLSFVPNPSITSVHLRLRTRKSSGQVMMLLTRENTAKLMLLVIIETSDTIIKLNCKII